MSDPAKASPEIDDLKEQLKTLRTEIASLADLVKDTLVNRAANTEEAIREQADDLARRAKETVDDAAERARGVAKTIEERITEKPVQSAMIALLIGMVIGSFGRR